MSATYTIIITQDGEERKRFENQDGDGKAFIWMLQHQGQSVSYALKWGGWKVEQINEQTKEPEFWKP